MSYYPKLEGCHIFLCVVITFAVSQTVILPPFSENEETCELGEIDYKAVVSDEAYQSIGISNDCRSACIAATLFECKAFTWAGPGSHCVLHGAFSKTQISIKPGSPYTITDLDCSSQGSSSLQKCGFEDRLVTIGLPESSHKLSGQLTIDDCRRSCEMDVITNCSSYAFDEKLLFHNGRNCITFTREESAIELPGGQYRLYENRCRIRQGNETIVVN